MIKKPTKITKKKEKKNEQKNILQLKYEKEKKKMKWENIWEKTISKDYIDYENEKKSLHFLYFKGSVFPPSTPHPLFFVHPLFSVHPG